MVNSINLNFSGGEGSYKVAGRSDLPVYKSLVEWMQNFVILPQGPFTFRPGTVYIHHTRRHNPAVFIPFFFSDQQAYLIEATEGFFRFYKDSGVITLADVTITNITQSSTATVTSPSHGYSNGDEVFIFNVVGMTEVNGRSFIVTNATTNTYEIFDQFGNDVDSTNYGAYASGGTTNKVYEIATPYQEEDLKRLQSAQNADTRYIVNRFYAPRKLTRTTETNWSLATFSRTADPFTGSDNWPGAVVFTSDGAIIYGGTINKPDTLFKSRTPADDGSSRYDDFTTGTGSGITKTHAAIFTLAAIHGKVDSIRWLANTSKFMVVGTYGSVRRVYGINEESPITPLDVNARSIDAFGVSPITPYPTGAGMLYVQRSGDVIRSIEFDYTIDGYQSLDKNLISDHLFQSSKMVQIANQTGNPEILWTCRDDGSLAGLTYNNKENKYGWHRHYIADGEVEWVETMPQENNRDILWLIVKRTVDGETVRHIEQLSVAPNYPERIRFFSGTEPENESPDMQRYNNALYELQKDAIHVDASISYDGTANGTVANATVTPGAGATTTGTTGVTFTSSAAVFTASMVGRHIWKKYDGTGVGGGRARIDAFVSSTQVTCTILSAFNNLTAMTPGNWFLTTASLSGLWHLEGETVTVVKDGATHPDRVVENGGIELTSQGSKIHVGLKYTGIMQTLPLDQGGLSGPAVTKVKIIKQFLMRFYNTSGCSIGSSLYNVQKIDFRTTGDVTGRPIPLYTGVKREKYSDNHERNKQIVLLQDVPLPCTIVTIEPYGETTDE